MTSMLLVAVLLIPNPSISAAPTPTQTLSEKRDVLQAEVAITTLPAADVKSQPAEKAIEHDSEVSRSEIVTVVVQVRGCQANTGGACNASADIVAYKPDGSVHAEIKNVSLGTRRGFATLPLASGDVTGVYKVVATVRDLDARRFAKTERFFGVK